MDFLTLVPSGCLLVANSSPLPRLALQTPCSSPQSPSALGTHVSGWGAQGRSTDCLCRSHSALPAMDQLLHSLLIAPEAPLLSQLISSPVRVLPQRQKPLLSFSSPFQRCRSHPTSSPPLFPFFFLSSYPVTWGPFLSL